MNPPRMRNGSTMRFQLDKDSRTPIYDQVREQLISALHLGEVKAGTKLPSVRQFARVHGINPKTIHRIYRRLNEEGYLELRPGSGAYVAQVQRGDLDGDRLLNLHKFFRTSLAECERMGVPADRALSMFESYVNRSKILQSRIGVVECNREHAGLFTHEIRARLGAQVIPLLVSSLTKQPSPALDGVSFLVTTTHHVQEVSGLAAPLGLKVLQVQLRSDFLPSLMQAAERGRLLLLVSNANGMDSTLQAMTLLGLSKAAAARIRFLSADDPAAVRREAAEADTIYVSNLVRDRVARLLPAGKRVLRFDRHLSSESLDLVEAAILFGTRRA